MAEYTKNWTHQTKTFLDFGKQGRILEWNAGRQQPLPKFDLLPLKVTVVDMFSYGKYDFYSCMTSIVMTSIVDQQQNYASKSILFGKFAWRSFKKK